MLAYFLGRLTIAASILIIFQLLRWSRTKSRRLPPRPKECSTSTKLWQRLGRHQATADDVVCLQKGSVTEIFLLSARAAIELLDARSAKYSSRPRSIFAFDLATGALGVSMCPYNGLFRKHRKVMKVALGASTVPTYDGILETHIELLIQNLVAEPENFRQHATTFTAGFILETVYGIDVRDNADVVKALDECNAAFFQASKTGSALERYPSMLLLPHAFSPWKQQARCCFDRELSLFRTLLSDARQRRRNGFAADLADTLTSLQGELQMTDDEAAYLAGSFFGAGAEAMTQVLLTFVLAITTHGQVQTEARAEISKVCGERAVSSADIDDLPFCEAMLLECLRWRPFAPLGAPHALIADDTYREFDIPEGASVFANIWAISRDPELWIDPEAFAPCRHLTDSPLRTKSPLHGVKKSFAFGFGRRICPGQSLALRVLTLATTRMLQSFTFTKALDSKGCPIEIDVENYSDGGLISIQPIR